MNKLKKTIINSSFIKHNKETINLKFLYFFAIFSYSTLFMQILNKHYGYSASDLSFLGTIFGISILSGFLWADNLLNKKISFLKHLNISIISSIFIMLLTIFSLIYEIKQAIYVLKYFEGFFNAYAGGILMYMLDIKLISNKRKTIYNGLIHSLTYIIKFIIPILTSYLVLNDTPYLPLVIAIIIYIYILLYLKKHNKIWNRSYYRYHLNTFDKEKGKHNSLRAFIIFFRIKEININSYRKIYMVILAFLQNFQRSFYDLYLPLILINIYGFSIKESILAISFMVIGQATSLFTGVIIEKVKLRYINVITRILYLISFSYFVFFYNEIHYITYFFIFLIGVGRSFEDNYVYKFSFFLINKELQLNHINSIKRFVSEAVNNGTYFILGILFSIGFFYDDIMNIFFVFSILSFIFSIVNFYIKEKVNAKM